MNDNPSSRSSSRRQAARMTVASLAAVASLGLLPGVAAAQYGGNPQPTNPPTDVQPGGVDQGGSPTTPATAGQAAASRGASRGASRSTLAFTGADVAGLAAMGGGAVAAGGGLLLVSRRRRQDR